MTTNKIITRNRWHSLYKGIFYLLVFVIVLLTVLMQPGADVPAPIIFGIVLILAIDSLYNEVILPLTNGNTWNGMVRSWIRMLYGKKYSWYLGLIGSISAGLFAWVFSLEVFNGDGSDFLIWFLIGSFIGTHRYLHGLHDRVKELEKK